MSEESTLQDAGAQSRSGINQDQWNRHRWRRETSWWDELEIDTSVHRGTEAVFEHLEEIAPDPYEHDFILYTDGSGCNKGWGGYAAVIERIDLSGEYREPVESHVIVSGTYGSTVRRCEFTAFLDGVWKILSDSCYTLQQQAKGDEEAMYKLGSEGVIHQFRGPDRISILWYTDRADLAQALLYDEEGDPLHKRDTDRDLWQRWSFMAKHVCITPMYRPRNVVDGQAICDELAGAARGLLKGAEEPLANAAEKFHPIDKWQKKKTQATQF